jgi:hypothetical protein
MADDKKDSHDTLVLTESIELFQQPTGTVFGIKAPRLEHLQKKPETFTIPRLQDVEHRPNITLGQWEDLRREDPIETSVFTKAMKVTRPIPQPRPDDPEVDLPKVVATGPRAATPHVEISRVLNDDSDRTRSMIVPEEGMPMPSWLETVYTFCLVVGVLGIVGMIAFFVTR